MASVLAAFLVIILLAAAGVGVFAYREITGAAFKKNLASVEIAEGSSTGAVAAKLKEAGIINSINCFKLYCRLTKADGTFQYGVHEFTSGRYAEAVESLQQPAVRETFSVTFPEGFTALNMAELLDERGVMTVEEFVSACAEDYDFDFVKAIPDDRELFIKLEGYLYPDTYEFFVDSTAHEIVEQMLKNFEAKMLTEEIKDKLNADGRSLHDALTLASIIQKEAFLGEEYNVSAVFNNRLAENSPVPRLESDTTWYYIYYVLDYYYGGRAPEALRDAYNSYGVAGHIAGPICSPGVGMLDAALSPVKSPYYYFLTDNNKKFYYAETVEGHEENIRIMNEVNASLKEAE